MIPEADVSSQWWWSQRGSRLPPHLLTHTRSAIASKRVVLTPCTEAWCGPATVRAACIAVHDEHDEPLAVPRRVFLKVTHLEMTGFANRDVVEAQREAWRV